MKKLVLKFSFFAAFLCVLGSLMQCKEKNPKLLVDYEINLDQPDPKLKPFDSTLINSFFEKFPKLETYKKEVKEVYSNHHYNYLWHESKGRKETAEVLYNRINAIATEGILQEVPYKEAFDNMLRQSSGTDLTTELFLTSYYFFYTHKVLAGIEQEKREEMGWFIEQESNSYVSYLDTLLANPGLVNKQTQLNRQYYLLKNVLDKYQKMARAGGWDSIQLPDSFKSLRFKDSSSVIKAVRKRLFLSGDLNEDSGSAIFDESLTGGVSNFQKRHGFLIDKTIGKKTIAALNVSVQDRIKTIVINMERCRWISPNISKDKEYIVVNIPAYRLLYIKNDSIALQSDVVVGATMYQTVIFSGKMKYIVFSPYWNIPQSIIKNEIIPGIRKNSNYLASHNMEWNNGQVRQKPGIQNALGLVKFIFPNSNSIYLHDTPSKSLFQRESRAFSHGCIRVARPKDLAETILSADPNWTLEKIEEAMNSGSEKWYPLKQEIPVYIGYFTAWTGRDGNINFYEDVYKRDPQLAALLIEKGTK
jgi:murein L,D-transpeptidase YcbB/YkuD